MGALRAFIDTAKTQKPFRDHFQSKRRLEREVLRRFLVKREFFDAALKWARSDFVLLFHEEMTASGLQPFEKAFKVKRAIKRFNLIGPCELVCQLYQANYDEYERYLIKRVDHNEKSVFALNMEGRQKAAFRFNFRLLKEILALDSGMRFQIFVDLAGKAAKEGDVGWFRFLCENGLDTKKRTSNGYTLL